MTKMTKIDALNSAIALAKMYAPDQAELNEKLNAMLAAEQKRASAPRKTTESKAHKENVARIPEVLEILTGNWQATTKEIADAMGISSQKAAAILRIAEDTGYVQANRDGKAVSWAKVDQPAAPEEDEGE